MSLQAFQQLRDNQAAAFKRIAELEAQVKELRRLIESQRPRLALPEKQKAA